MMNNKTRVGLISFHNAYNYGASLQAYGLQEALRMIGTEAEYINYVNDHRKIMYNTSAQIKNALKRKKIVRAARLMIGAGFISARGKRFKEFSRKYLHVTEKEYKNSSEVHELNDYYDKFIVGSDQVWNCNNNGGDIAFLLDFVDNPEKKISYASSFGMDDIPEEFRSSYSNALLTIGRLSVRETAGAKIVKKYSNREAHVVLDPVFLPGVEKWENLKQDGKVKNEDYIFFYTNRNSQIRDFWNLKYPKGNLKSHILSSYVGVKDFISKDVSIRVAMSPTDFINEIASAKLVVTASFHCVAFSIIFHKQFVVFLTGVKGKDERILNLLRICGLESRIINVDTKVEDINKKIDYDVVDRKLEPYLDYSREFLRHAVCSLPDVDKLSFPSGDSDYFCDDARCTGCMACVSACPTKAIQIESDKEGFLIPKRITEKCVNCYKCHSVCQAFSEEKKILNSQEYYAFKNSQQVRENSSSGGVFTALSDEILNKKGVVCASLLTEDFKAKHVFAFTTAERDKMRKTLYVQSDVSEVYEQIRDLLSKKTPVLFVGTPCQVEGINRFFSSSEEKNLYTCDLVCHGVPSPGVFEKFIDFIGNGELTEFNFRDKSMGWKHGYTVSAVIGRKKVCNTLKIQSFSKMFSHNLINRTSCADCKFANYNRVGDITIGDFWGIEKIRNEFADSLGVSLLIVNTEKGKSLIQSFSDTSCIRVEKNETKQNSLVKPAVASENRLDAFRILNNEGYSKLAKKYGENNFKGLLKKLLRELI